MKSKSLVSSIVQEYVKAKQLDTLSWGNDGLSFVFKVSGVCYGVVALWGDGWDYVGVSNPSACPTWKVMCFFKDLFFDSEECVVQYHPSKDQYVNNHPNCLHLWKPQEEDFPIPPTDMI